MKHLPGTPDIAFPGRKKAIFVHGCFWHGHENCKLATVPKTRSEFWIEKIAANRDRDTRKVDSLRKLGWESIVVWQCELKSPLKLLSRLRHAIGKKKSQKPESEVSDLD